MDGSFPPLLPSSMLEKSVVPRFFVTSCWQETKCAPLQQIPKVAVPEKEPRSWNVKLRREVLECCEPVRGLVDSLSKKSVTPDKPLISLGLGDPGLAGEFLVPKEAADAVAKTVESFKFNGYTHSAGSINCRRAVSDYLSTELPHPVSADDIFITPGCSQALVYIISALASKGCNILIPRPAFPIYEAICIYHGVECRGYNLIPHQGWEANLDEMEVLADSNTVALVVCNPSNPCGSAYSYRHLEKISQLAQRLKIPIIADEIYAKMVFSGQTFVPMATFSRNVPVFTVGGLSKRWFAPGWRLGWLCISDPYGIFENAGINQAMLNIAQINLGASSIIQESVPMILANTPETYFSDALGSLERAARLCYSKANAIDELSCPWEPQGAMYVMVQIHVDKLNGITDDKVFADMLLEEESVIVMPGSSFALPNWFRIQLAVSFPVLEDAWSRICDFCSRHARIRTQLAGL